MLCSSPMVFKLLGKTKRLASPYRCTGSPDTQPGHSHDAQKSYSLARTSTPGKRQRRRSGIATHAIDPLCMSSISDQVQDVSDTLQKTMPFLNALLGAVRPSMDQVQNRELAALAVHFLQQCLGLSACVWLFLNGVNFCAAQAPAVCTVPEAAPARVVASAPGASQQEAQHRPHCIINLHEGPVSVNSCSPNSVQVVSAPAPGGLLTA